MPITGSGSLLKSTTKASWGKASHNSAKRQLQDRPKAKVFSKVKRKLPSRVWHLCYPMFALAFAPVPSLQAWLLGSQQGAAQVRCFGIGNDMLCRALALLEGL